MMLEGTEKVEFIREGLRRYPPARETVDFFELEVVDELKRAFSARQDWVSLEPSRDEHQGLMFGKSIGSTDRQIQVWISGLRRGTLITPSNVSLILGLYWNPPRRPGAPVVAAAHALNEKWLPVPLSDVAGRDKTILAGSLYRKSERRLFVDIGDDFDPAKTFAQLLDAADRGLAS